MRDEVLTHLWRTDATGRGPITLDEIERDLEVPWFEVADALTVLIQKGVVRPAGQLPNGVSTYEVVPQKTTR